MVLKMEEGFELGKGFGLKPWQQEILDKEDFGALEPFGFNQLQPKQREWIEKVLESEDIYMVPKYADILRKVLNDGWYLGVDREALNWVRDSYLKGKNFIK